MTSASSFCFIIILAMLTRIARSVPDEFCLDYFDDGDCGKPPTSVLYYYKPGSRCEVRTWRGCPTLNKFPTYFSCVHFCIARIWGDPLDVPVLTASGEVMEQTKAIKVAEIEEAQLEWKEEVKTLKVEEIKTIDKILDKVVELVEHQHQKLSLHHSGEEESEETTTFSYPTIPSDFEFSEEEVAVVP